MGTGAAPQLHSFETCGLTCVSAGVSVRGAAFAFVGRSGGVSTGAYSSLNVDERCGDDPRAVAENRRRACAAIGATGAPYATIIPHQVHGTRVVRIASPSDLGAARSEAQDGADGVVCTVVGVPVLMAFADCAPVVLVAPGGFALVHAGWRGTLAGIAGEVALALANQTGSAASELWAYVGPHIGPDSYEVSDDLLARFVSTFGRAVAAASPRHLDLGAAVTASLLAAGLREECIVMCEADTARDARWFSFRASGGTCGRHAALAWLVPPGSGSASYPERGYEGRDDRGR